MIITQKRKITIGVLTPPIGVHSLIPLSNLLNILLTQSESIYLVTGNEGLNTFKNTHDVYTSGVNHTGRGNSVLRIISFFILQVRLSIALLKVVKKCDVWIFFLGGENMLLPMCVAKLFRKKVYLMFAGSSVHTLFYDELVKWLGVLTTINCILSDKIILYSKNLVNEWNLKHWENKIVFAHEHIIDCRKFSISIPYDDRDMLIGYVGRLSEEKGIWNFILAINLIIKERPDVKFLIIGDGQLREKIGQYLDQNNLRSFVMLEDWIAHDELPHYLNRLRLLVLPSYTEGLPNIMLEAMACGTPVLATPVGAMPDVLQEGKTGFIIENNSPDCIKRNVMRALSCPVCEKIAENGPQFVEENYSFDKTAELWNNLIDNLI